MTDSKNECVNLSIYQNCDCFICSHCGNAYEVAQLTYDDDEFCTLDDAIAVFGHTVGECDVSYCPSCGYKIVESA